MKVVWGFDNPPLLRNAVATVGSYDGVHRGHRILLDEVVRRARECEGESVVLTFEPHPRITLGNDEGLRLLTSFEEKCALLEKVGIDYVVVIPFDKAFSHLSREEFTDDYLVGKLRIKQLIVGYNHHFGHNKEGDRSFLANHGVLEVVEVAQYLADGDKVSSTVIRHAIEQGDMALAARLLGHPYTVIGEADAEGRVATGDYKLLPCDGLYKAKINNEDFEVELRNGELWQKRYFSQKIEIAL